MGGTQGTLVWVELFVLFGWNSRNSCWVELRELLLGRTQGILVWVKLRKFLFIRDLLVELWELLFGWNSGNSCLGRTQGTLVGLNSGNSCLGGTQGTLVWEGLRELLFGLNSVDYCLGATQGTLVGTQGTLIEALIASKSGT